MAFIMYIYIGSTSPHTHTHIYIYICIYRSITQRFLYVSPRVIPANSDCLSFSKHFFLWWSFKELTDFWEKMVGHRNILILRVIHNTDGRTLGTKKHGYAMDILWISYGYGYLMDFHQWRLNWNKISDWSDVDFSSLFRAALVSQDRLKFEVELVWDIHRHAAWSFRWWPTSLGCFKWRFPKSWGYP